VSWRRGVRANAPALQAILKTRTQTIRPRVQWGQRATGSVEGGGAASLHVLAGLLEDKLARTVNA